MLACPTLRGKLQARASPFVAHNCEWSSVLGCTLLCCVVLCNYSCADMQQRNIYILCGPPAARCSAAPKAPSLGPCC